MKVLALDTSSPMISVALGDMTRIVGEFNQIGNASTLLAPAIQTILKQGRTSLNEIDAFVIGEGPGSYNGLRCGFATLAGILMTAPKPVVQLNSLALTAAGAKCERVGVILNARKNMLFYQTFKLEDGVPLLEGEAMIENEQQIPESASRDTCWISCEVSGFEPCFPSAAEAVRLALPILQKPGFKGELTEPRYLRPPV